MRSLSAAVLLALVTALYASAARAETFTDPEAGFRVDVPVEADEVPCVLVPEYRTDDESCEGVDRASHRLEDKESHTVGLILLRGDTSGRKVTVAREASVTTRPLGYAQLQTNLVRSLQAGAPAGVKVTEKNRWITSANGADVVVVEVSARGAEGESTSFMAYVPIDGGGYAIMVTGEPTERHELDGLFRRILDSLQVTPPTLEPSIEADPRMKDPAYRAGYRIGESFTWVWTCAWYLSSLVALIVLGIRGQKAWKATPEVATAGPRAAAAPASARAPNPFKTSAAKSGALPSTFFSGYGEKKDDSRLT